MKKKIAVILIISIIFCSLSACASSKQTLYVYNFGNYVDPVINDMFEEEFNCRVVYETYDSNEELYMKLKNGNSTYDVIFPS